MGVYERQEARNGSDGESSERSGIENIGYEGRGVKERPVSAGGVKRSGREVGREGCEGTGVQGEV